MGSFRLTLLRHAEAARQADGEDFERLLTERGTAEARAVASRLNEPGLRPELIIASPAERCRATAAIVASACEVEPQRLRYVPELYLAEPDTVWHLITGRDWGVGHLLICGHNPGLSQVAKQFNRLGLRNDLPTAGFATAMRHDAQWGPFECS